MPPTYYVIELSARWLTALLIALAAALAMAFAFGYGAARSVLQEHPPALPAVSATATATPLAEQVLGATPVVTPSVETPTVVATPVATSRATAVPTPPPTATPRPTVAPTATAPPPTATPGITGVGNGFWVQVVAVSNPGEIPDIRGRLEELKFPRSNQRLVQSEVAGGGRLYKLQIGPFPDRESADRVVLRMQASGFPDAWVVVP